MCPHDRLICDAYGRTHVYTHDGSYVAGVYERYIVCPTVGPRARTSSNSNDSRHGGYGGIILEPGDNRRRYLSKSTEMRNLRIEKSVANRALEIYPHNNLF